MGRRELHTHGFHGFPAGGASHETKSFLAGNYRRYLQILADPRDEAQRRIILKLLAEEEAAQREAPSKKNKAPQQAA
jgi:hypothetical protein